MTAFADEPPAEGEETVVVQGERSTAPDPASTSAAVTVIEVDEHLPPAMDVASALETAAGAVVDRLGGLGDFSAVSLRGSGLQHVVVCLDGVPLNPDGTSVVDLSELPLRSFDRVEVYRGGGPPALASAALGGVVNLVSPDEGAPPELAVSVGNLGTARLHASGATPAVLLAVDAFTTAGDFAYFDDRGTRYNDVDDRVAIRENNDTRQIAAHGRVRFGGDRLQLTVLDSVLLREEGVPGPSGRPTEHVRFGTGRHLVVAEISGGTTAWQASGRVWGLRREERLDDREGEVGVGAQWTRDTSAALGSRAHVSWVPDERLVASLDADLRADRYVARERMAKVTASPRSRWAGTVAASAVVRTRDERWGAFPVLQLTRIGEESAFVPRVGLLARPIEGLSLKANAGRAYRAPDFLELYGDRGAMVGNPDLVPEHGWQADIGAYWRLPDNPVASGTVELGHFWSERRDLIVYVQNAQRTSRPINLDHTWVQGIEAAVGLAVGDWLEVHGNLTRTVSVNLSSDPAYANNRLPRVPGWEWHHRLSVVPIPRLRLGHTLSTTDGTYWDATNWFAAPPRVLHGLFVEASSPDGLSVSLSALNLTDRLAESVPRNPLDPSDRTFIQQPISDFAGYPLPGRTLLATVRWTPPSRSTP